MKKVIFGGIMTIVASSILAVTVIPPNEYEVTYYSDATKTEVIGNRTLMCTGSEVSYGSTSPYFTKEIGDACPGYKAPNDSFCKFYPKDPQCPGSTSFPKTF